MKFLTRKESVARKILIILLVALILIFAVTPNYSSVQAVEVIEEEDMPDAGGDIMGSLLKQIIQIFAAVGDIAMGVLNHFMLGADGFTSAMLSADNANINNPDSWLYAGDVPDDEIDFEYGDGTIDTSEFFVWTGDTFDIPNFLYSPEAIFSNNIAALDVNFLNPNTYTSVAETDSAQKASESAAGGVLRQTISDWYISFRNIAIVGLLSVLVYLGIRILISSTAVDKAKYKESLRSWVVALCLVFFIHFIMSGLLMITDKFTDLFSDSANAGITVKVHNDSINKDIKFRTNLIGFVRFNAQSVSMYNTAAYTIMYLALVFYTFIFTFMYFKRFLYMAFFTMIAPLVALTYPVDKAGDGQAQAFNLWFKEYTMNLILQPVHLILYVALVSSAMDLVKQNIIYGLVAIAFLIPAEKFIKKMFGMDKAETPSGFGSFAAGAATMSGFKQVASMLGGGKGKNSNGGNSNSSTTTDRNSNRVRTQERGFLESFNNGNNEGSSQQLPQGDNSIDENQADAQQEGQQPRQQQQPFGQRQQEATSPEHQRMLDDRDAWQSIIDDPNTSDSDREEAQQQVDLINGDMRDRGFISDEERQYQDMLDTRDAWQSIADDPNASDLDREEAQQQIDLINGDMRDRGFIGQEEPEQEAPPEQNDFNQLGQQNQPEQLSMPGENTTTNNGQQSTQTGNNVDIGIPERRPDWAKKRAIRGAKKLGKIALKGAKLTTQALGVVGGATVGLAAGLTTGDMSKAMTYMGAGAIAGRQIGKAVGNLPEAAWNGRNTVVDKVRDKQEEYQYNRDKDMYGVGYAAEQAAQRQNARVRQQFLDNKNEQEKYEEMAGRIKTATGRDVSTEDLMKSAFDYRKAGITDEKQIENGLTMEAKYGGVNGDNHEKMMDVVNMANSYGRDYVIDDKKRNSLQTLIKDKVNGEQNQNEVWKFYTETLGFNEKTANRYAINPPQQQTQTQQQAPSTGTTQQPGSSRTTTRQAQQSDSTAQSSRQVQSPRQTQQQSSTRQQQPRQVERPNSTNQPRRRPGRPRRNPQQPPNQQQ